MKLNKHFAGAAGIVVVAASLIALTWTATLRAVRAERNETIARVTATVSNQALTFAEQINRQILALDQTLRILESAWESNPAQFDLEAWKSRTPALGGLGQDLILTDENGIVRQSTMVDAINRNIANLDFFVTFSQGTVPGDGTYIGPATIGQIMRAWHMDVAGRCTPPTAPSRASSTPITGSAPSPMSLPKRISAPVRSCPWSA
jgi:hypothetical protein